MNISLTDFAAEIGISPGYLSQIENGKKTNPNLDIILKIADALNIRIEALLGSERQPEAPSLRIPSLLRLVVARDRNMKVLEDREAQRKICNILDYALNSKYMIEDTELYGMFLDDVHMQMETTLKRYIAMDILVHKKKSAHDTAVKP